MAALLLGVSVVTKNGDQSPAAGTDGSSSGDVPAPESFVVESTAAARSDAPTPQGRGARDKPLSIRRVPKPRLRGFLDSPHRNLILGILYTLTVMAVGTTAYMILRDDTNGNYELISLQRAGRPRATISVPSRMRIEPWVHDARLNQGCAICRRCQAGAKEGA